MVRPATHPGEILADELQELEMSAADYHQIGARLVREIRNS